MRLILIVTVALAAGVTTARAQNYAGAAASTSHRSAVPDFSQAKLFLRFLRATAAGPPDSALVDSVLHQAGTTLVIQQQNITRSVTAEQYRMVLLHAADSVAPTFARADNERAQRGITGLVRDVWPAIHWGSRHVDALEQYLATLEHVDYEVAARQRALRFLPRGAEINAKLSVVMGGRAGASAFDDGRIYVDVLTEAFRADFRKQSFPPAEQFTTFFAHEMHHLGLTPIIARTRAGLQLTRPQADAWDFLSLLVSEGSASYFTGPRNLAVMSQSPEYASYLRDPAALLATCEHVLEAALHEGVTGDALDHLQAPLVGSGWHAAGALMFAAIDKAGGFDAVLPVLKDPRQLLAAYNRTRPARAFSESLAREVAVMGQTRRP